MCYVDQKYVDTVSPPLRSIELSSIHLLWNQLLDPCWCSCMNEDVTKNYLLSIEVEINNFIMWDYLIVIQIIALLKAISLLT